MSAIIIFILIVACKDKSSKTVDINPKATITFSGDYIICDTCQTTILVHHDECTTCGEITVDSGTIYLTSDIVRSANKLAINSDEPDTFLLPPNYVALHELYFSDKHYFNKLWTDTVNFKDFYKTFRLTGKVVEIKRRVLDNEIVENYPSLFFKVDKAVQVDTSYLKKVKAQQ